MMGAEDCAFVIRGLSLDYECSESIYERSSSDHTAAHMAHAACQNW